MLYHPAKVPALVFTLLFISHSAYCDFGFTQFQTNLSILFIDIFWDNRLPRLALMDSDKWYKSAHVITCTKMNQWILINFATFLHFFLCDPSLERSLRDVDSYKANYFFSKIWWQMKICIKLAPNWMKLAYFQKVLHNIDIKKYPYFYSILMAFPQERPATKILRTKQ